MRPFCRLSLALLIIIGLHALAPAAAAHPLGNFTINQSAGLRLSADGLTLDYVVDMAEIPAFQELADLPLDAAGRPALAAAAGYAAAQCAARLPDLAVGLDGERLTLHLRESGVTFPEGAGGLLTLRLTCLFRAEWPALDRPHQLSFANHAFAERLGWREITATGDGLAVESPVPEVSPSGRLTRYPEDLLTSPLDQRQVTVTISPLATGAEPAAARPGAAPAGAAGAARGDPFTDLITAPELTLPTLLVSLVIAIAWGTMHALTPGHGKTIVGAYLVGARGTARHALYLGLTTTVTHTAGVFALGLITLAASEFIIPERLFPWLSLISGILVVAIGLNLLAIRLRGLLSRLQLAPASTLAGHAHPYPHDHEHLHPHDHDHEHPHDHGLEHGHSHGAHDHHHDHDQGPAHAHGGHTHSHLPPGADGSPVAWRSLLALGISGGLLPCPSALVVMLGAIALGRIGWGLILVLAFSLGLAGALTAVGLLLVYAGRLFARIPSLNRAVGLVSVGSAGLITLAGFGIAAQALAQMGWLKL